ncbi:helix-turn-helix transcriptional regulator [Pelomonas cellulosilytica]|uniref:Helix-turn-helix transcriptional regulator n=1 Tax=Pelomonas cellulosilytica TaxID=2906762 RepID=A0ABS8XZ66_9BURK|nr:helix-turn-helix transcriptional regulator [Pelomonas sp. P8]MCE4557137.1 helix-turn-helix transcriptional regulator [Pelomonas sp. P8]
MTIGKTRPARGLPPARGVLHRLRVGEFAHGRVEAPTDLADRVEHFWLVRWNLEGLPPQVQETLPHPNLHLVVEPERADLWGVHTGRWTRRLEGRSMAFGIKFRPGALRAWLGRAVSGLANASLPAQALMGDDVQRLAEVLHAADDASAADLASDVLRAHLPPSSEPALLAGRIVDSAAADHELLSAQQLADRWGMTLRSLQRFFSQHVGVGPKWVINRYRLHEALARVQAGQPVSWAALAQELGYFDQAHFIADFRRLVGCTPAAYSQAWHRR